MNLSADARRCFLRRALVVTLVVVATLIVGAVGTSTELQWEALRDRAANGRMFTKTNPVTAVAVFVAIYVAVAVLSVPVTAALSVLAGALFGQMLGTATVSVASTTGATLAFLMCRYLFREWARHRIGRRFAGLEVAATRDGVYHLIALRLTPAVPFALVNLLMSLTPMRATTFAAVSWAAMVPCTFLYASAGATLATVEHPRDVLTPHVIASLTAIGLLPLALRMLTRWRQSDTNELHAA